MINIKKILITQNNTIKDVIKKIKSNGQGACFIVSKSRKLLGIITDGDLRKIILSNKKLDTKIKNLYNKKVYSLSVKAENAFVQQKLKEGIKIIPLLDSDGKVVDFVSRTKFKNIPINKPDLTGNETNYVIDCLKSTFISSQGKYINIFEKKFKKYYNAKFALAVSNCTSGIMLVLKCLNLKKNDEVIVPNVTFASPINAIINSGAKPVLCDIDEKNYTIKIDSLKKLISKKTKAIICVHTYGHPCEMNKIKSIVSGKNIKVIEDCAESIGTKFRNKKVGTFGDFSVFSFFGNKTLTTGEGGMVLIKSEDDFNNCKILRDHGMDPQKKYWHDKTGFNFRMTNLQAAIGVAQLEKINYLIREKIKIAKLYNKYLKKSENIILPLEEKWANHSYWLYNIVIKNIDEKIRDNFINKLGESGIEVRPMFYPASDMPIFKKYTRNKNMRKVSYQGISLPSFIGLKNNDIYSISKKIMELTNNLNK